MSKPQSRRGRWAWTDGWRTTRQESDGVLSLSFSLSTLVSKRFLSQRAFKRFQQETGLRDLSWRVVYACGQERKPLPLREHLKRHRGGIVFMHGWDGSGEIWENLPVLVSQAYPRLVSLVPDVNGFGGTPFLDDVPRVKHCSPRGLMQAVELWLGLLHFRPHRGRRSRRPLIFVGHSMGGAALFYKEDQGWENQPYGLCAVAPALLHNDGLRKGFYVTLGVSIGAGLQLDFLDRFKDKLAPSIIRVLIEGASRKVKNEHRRIFANTSKGTLAQTFYALGLAEGKVERANWDNFRVILGHRDRLVGVAPMLELLESLGLGSDNIRVVLGDHYFFSHGKGSPGEHARNREILLAEILTLYERVRRQRLPAGKMNAPS
ncbi:MAG: alpha/beta hydrolase [Chloroflexota bacterium]|nr:alpha/beta hydrolase [Chloroflexota bacterium]